MNPLISLFDEKVQKVPQGWSVTGYNWNGLRGLPLTAYLASFKDERADRLYPALPGDNFRKGIENIEKQYRSLYEGRKSPSS